MKLGTRQRVFGVCLLLLLCTSECISIKTQIDHTLNSKAQFTTVHQLSKAVSLVQNNMDVFSENFNPNDILEIVNGPLFEKAIGSKSQASCNSVLTSCGKTTLVAGARRMNS